MVIDILSMQAHQKGYNREQYKGIEVFVWVRVRVGKFYQVSTQLRLPDKPEADSCSALILIPSSAPPPSPPSSPLQF